MNTKKVQWTLTSIISALSLFVTGVVVNAETYEVRITLLSKSLLN